jgi:hypothetical protein
MGTVHQLVRQGQPDRGLCCCSEAATPPAVFPTGTFYPLHEDEQARVGLQHHCSNALSSQAPVCSQVAITWTQWRGGVMCDVEQSWYGSRAQCRYMFICVWAAKVGGRVHKGDANLKSTASVYLPQLARPCGSLLRSCMQTAGHKAHNPDMTELPKKHCCFSSGQCKRHDKALSNPCPLLSSIHDPTGCRSADIESTPGSAAVQTCHGYNHASPRQTHSSSPCTCTHSRTVGSIS